MIGATTQFEQEVATSQQVFAGAYVWGNGKVLEETLRFGWHTTKAPLGYLAGYYTVGNVPADPKIMLLNGSVTRDRRSDVRGTADVTWLDITGTGGGQYLVDPLSGFEFLIYRGIRLTGSLPGLQNWEWKPMGMFTVQNVDIVRHGDALIYKTQLSDRSKRIDDNPWKYPFQVSASTGNYIACIKAVINDRAKGFTPDYIVTATNNTSPPAALNFDAGTSPWSAVKQMADAGSMEVFFDGRGSVYIQDYPDPTLAKPVALFSKDSEVVLEQPERQVSKSDVYNGVIVRANAPWLLFPVSGEVWDEDPSSPTWRLGPFGEKPKIIENSIVGSNASAAAVAATEYTKIKGVWENLTFKTYPDPRLEVGDVIRIDDEVLGVEQKVVLDSITLPLITGSMSAITRRRR